MFSCVIVFFVVCSWFLVSGCVFLVVCSLLLVVCRLIFVLRKETSVRERRIDDDRGFHARVFWRVEKLASSSPRQPAAVAMRS